MEEHDKSVRSAILSRKFQLDYRMMWMELRVLQFSFCFAKLEKNRYLYFVHLVNSSRAFFIERVYWSSTVDTIHTPLTLDSGKYNAFPCREYNFESTMRIDKFNNSSVFYEWTTLNEIFYALALSSAQTLAVQLFSIYKNVTAITF